MLQEGLLVAKISIFALGAGGHPSGEWDAVPKREEGGQRRGAALSDEESMGEGKRGGRVEGDLYGEAMRCHAALSCSQVVYLQHVFL